MKKWILALLVLSTFACSEDENPVSSGAFVINFSVDTSEDFTPERTIIDTTNAQLYAFHDGSLKDLTYPLSLNPSIEVSPGASISPASGTPVTIDHPEDFVSYEVKSGDGLEMNTYIFTIRDRQIPNSGFDNWHMQMGANAKTFEQPGKHLESTAWATANMGTSIYSIYGTTPLTEGENTMAKIETVETVALPVVAGALYVGKFDVDGAINDPTNPLAATKFGIPFHYKPSAIKFKYSYNSGDQLVQAILKDPGNLFGGFDIINLEGKDKFGIEAFLERRVGNEIVTVAKTGLISDVEVESLTETSLSFDYLNDMEPTHFYITFSPSDDGGSFKGAIGSALIIDDLEMIYE